MSMRNLTIALLVLAGAVLLPAKAFAGDRDRNRNRGPDRGPRVTVGTVTGRIDLDRSRLAFPYRDLRGHGRRPVFPMIVRWAPGHWEDRTVSVWVEATYRTEYVPPVYEERRGRYGQIYRILVRAGYDRTICVPGHYEYRVQRFWVPPAPIYRSR